MKIKLLLLWIALPCLLFFDPAPAHTQSETTETEDLIGVDVLFIVDQSGSMVDGPLNSSGQREAPTDRDGLSISAVRDGFTPIFDRLVQRQIARQDVDLLAEEYRFGLLLFGTNADADDDDAIPLTRIELVTDPATGLVQPNIEEQFPNPADLKNRGDTSFSRAFRLACEMFGNSPECTEPFPEHRRRIIVLLTDGHPSVQDDPNAMETDYHLNPGAYFDRLRQRYSNLFDHSELWVLGIDQTDRFWPQNEAEWEELAPGRTRRVNSPADVSRIFQNIADGIFADTGNEFEIGVCDTQSIFVPPYLASMTLILNYTDTDSRAQFTSPSGMTLSSPREEGAEIAPPGAPNRVRAYNRTLLSEIFTIARPEPGNWSCSLVGRGGVPEYRKREGLFQTSELEASTTTGQLASTCQNFGITVSYRDVGGLVLHEDPDYPLLQQATVSLNDGRTKTIDLQLTEGRTDQWESVQLIEPDITGGTYTVTVDIHLDRNDSPIFTESGQVYVSPEYPCAIEIVQPASQETTDLAEFYWPWEGWYPDIPEDKILPIGIAIQLKRTDGSIVDENLFTQPLGDVVNATVIDPLGEHNPVELSYDQENGILQGQVPQLTQIGTYTVAVDMNAFTSGQDIAFHIEEEMVEFTRELPLEVLRVQQVLIGTGGILFLLTCVVLAFFMWLMMPPYPEGSLIIEQRINGQWDDGNKSYPIRSPTYNFFGLPFLPTKWPRIKKRHLPASLKLRYLEVHRARSGRGITVKVVADKKSPIRSTEKTFRRNELHNLSPDVRLRYETAQKP